jgi:hypothetical protein
MTTLADRPRYPIHDLFVRPLEAEQQGTTIRLRLIGDRDHLLRRLGDAESIRLPARTTFGPSLQTLADEVWVLEEGEAEMFWRDDRRGSPTCGRQHRLRAFAPLLWLVPFGVAFGLRSVQPCSLLRLSTHAANGDLAPSPWPEEW